MTKSSIRKRLSWLLIISMSSMSLLAAVAVFYFAYQEAQEFQDDTLRQIGQLTLPNNTLTSADKQDAEYRLQVIPLASRNRPAWLSANLKTGFYELMSEQDRFRVWISPQQLAVIQPTSERDELAFNSALRTLLPMLLLLPLVLSILLWGVRRELRSIEQLARQVDEWATQIPQALPAHSTPQELTTFIDAINRLLARLHNALMQQKRFTADAAHELRTPLTALSLQLQNLEQANNMNDVQQRLIPLKTGIQRSIHLAEQLLDLNRLQGMPLIKKPLLLTNFLRQLIALYLDKAEAKTIDLGLMIDQTIIIDSNEEALMLILGNALDNAIKYTPEQGRVTLSAYCDNHCLTIEVEDNGIGLDLNQAQHVFKAFVRAKDTTAMGHGLGLAIAQSAAEQLEGHLSLHPAQERGLIFRYQQQGCEHE